MRILHTADVHLGKATHGKVVGGRSSRLDDFAATFLRFAHTAVERDVDLAIIAGDLFDTRRPGPAEIRAAVQPLRVLSASKIRTVIVPGNHDGMGTIADPESHTLGWMAELDMPYVHVFTVPSDRVLGTKSGAVCVVSVPYPHKRAYDAMLPDLAPDERVERISRDVTSAIAGMIEGARRLTKRDGYDVPLIFVGHLTVVGGKAGAERLMRMGWDVSISPEAFDGVDYAALGHLHPVQQVAPRVWYSGSPDYHDFTEAGVEKVFLQVDVGASLEVTAIPTRARRLVVVESREDDEWALPYPPDYVDGATVLLRLYPSSAPRVPGSVLLQHRESLYAAGAFFVKDETVRPEEVRRARVQIDPEVEVFTAITRWAESRGVDPERVLPVARELVEGFRVE